MKRIFLVLLSGMAIGSAVQYRIDLQIVQSAFQSTVPGITANVQQAAALLDLAEGK